jgi:hypothetical protein
VEPLEPVEPLALQVIPEHQETQATPEITVLEGTAAQPEAQEPPGTRAPQATLEPKAAAVVVVVVGPTTSPVPRLRELRQTLQQDPVMLEARGKA